MTLSIKDCGFAFLITLDLIIFYVFTKRVPPIVTNFKRPIYQPFS